MKLFLILKGTAKLSYKVVVIMFLMKSPVMRNMSDKITLFSFYGVHEIITGPANMEIYYQLLRLTVGAR